MAPKISQFYAEINHDNKIFKRIEHLFTNKELLALDKEQERLLTLKYKNLVRNGAALSDSQKRRYQNINIRLSELHTKFSNNVLSEEENYFVIIDSSNLSGLPQSLISAYSQAAEALGYEKKYLIANTRSSVEPFLKFSAERNLRKKVWMNYYNRGDNGDLFDNNDIIKEILRLRHERSKLLGYKNYAEWRLEDRMAGHPGIDGGPEGERVHWLGPDQARRSSGPRGNQDLHRLRNGWKANDDAPGESRGRSEVHARL